MQIDLEPYCNVPANCRFECEVVGAGSDDTQDGMAAAYRLATRRGIHPYTAFTAWETMSSQWHDVLEDIDSPDQDLSDYYPLAVWADVWGELRELIVTSAARSLPDGVVEFRLRVDWDGREPQPDDDDWLYLLKGGTAEKVVPAWKYVDYFHSREPAANS